MSDSEDTARGERIVRYFDGALSPEEMRDFNAEMKSEPAARAELREIAEQAIAMSDLARGRNLERVPRVRSVEESRKSPAVSRWLPLAAAAVLVAGLFAIVFGWSSKPVAVADVEFADGAAYWIDGESGEVRGLEPGQAVPPGTLIVEGASSSAQVSFEDGTRVTLEGDSEVAISQHLGKRFVLRKGGLSADVAPQGEGTPLRVITPTAEVEVLGTIFSVVVDSGGTSLEVSSGAVRLRRLADGESIEVREGHFVTTSLDTSEELRIRSALALPDTWDADLGNGNNDITKGLHATVGGTPCLQSVPYIAGREDDGRKVIRRGVSFNADVKNGQALAQLSERSHILVRYRGDWSPSVFLGTQKPTGGFGGNFEYRLRESDSEPDEWGWREVAIPIGRFELLRKLENRDYEITGNHLTKILVSTVDYKRLEVAKVAVEER